MSKNRYNKKHPLPAVLTAGNSFNLKLALATFFYTRATKF